MIARELIDPIREMIGMRRTFVSETARFSPRKRYLDTQSASQIITVITQSAIFSSLQVNEITLAFWIPRNMSCAQDAEVITKDRSKLIRYAYITAMRKKTIKSHRHSELIPDHANS